jgi:hypothetical protein
VRAGIPTQAIQPLPLEEKQKTTSGLAFLDKGRCIPYSYGTEVLFVTSIVRFLPKPFISRKGSGPEKMAK